MASKVRKGKYDDGVSQFIDDFWAKEFRSPTIREVMGATGITSTSTAYYVLQKVAKDRGDIFTGGMAAQVTPSWVIRAIRNAAPAL